MIRRFIAGYAAICVLFFSCIHPARAFAPVAVLAAPVFVGAGGTSWGMGALMGAIGATLAYLQITDSLDNAARVPLAEGASSEPPAPAAPASSVPSSNVVWWFQYSSASDACAALANQDLASKNGLCNGQPANYSLTGVGYTSGSATTATCRWTLSATYAVNGNVCMYPIQSTSPVTGVVTLVCGSGYTLSGSNCVLSNPRQATPDKKCDLKFNASKYMYYDDADCPTGPTLDHSKAVPGLRSDGDVVFIPGTVDGQPVLLKLLQQRDSQTGAVTERVLEYYRQVGPNVEKTTATLSPTAQVQSVTQTLSPGALSSPATSPTAASTPDTATTTPQAQTDPTKQPTLAFPDDYAREPTTQAIKSGVDQLHRDLTDQQNQTDPTIAAPQEFTDSFFKDTFNALKGWQLPSHSSTCPTGNLSLFGNAYVIDSHCTLINNHWGALQAAMGVVWSLMALFIVLRA